MPKAKAKKTVDTPSIDMKIPFPDDFSELTDDGNFVIYSDEETIRMIPDVAGELMMSRRLPVEVDSVGIDDPLVLWLITKRAKEFDDEGTDAILAARHIYSRRIQECNQESIIISLTAHTEIVGAFDGLGKMIEPEPYGANEIPFSGKRGKSSFLVSVQNRADDIPELHRNLKNPYEARLKRLHDTVNKAGNEFYLSVISEVNRAVVAVTAGLVETDDAGFQPGDADKQVDVHSDAVDTEQ